MNGVPWWFCAGQPGFGATLESVDPGGHIATAIPMDRVVGCVVHASVSTLEPGVVQHRMGQGLIIGDPKVGSQTPDGSISERVQRTVSLLSGAGFDAACRDPGLRTAVVCRTSSDIRGVMWDGPSGLLENIPPSCLKSVTYKPMEIRLWNGSGFFGASAEEIGRAHV